VSRAGAAGNAGAASNTSHAAASQRASMGYFSKAYFTGGSLTP